MVLKRVAKKKFNSSQLHSMMDPSSEYLTYTCVPSVSASWLSHYDSFVYRDKGYFLMRKNLRNQHLYMTCDNANLLRSS